MSLYKRSGLTIYYINIISHIFYKNITESVSLLDILKIARKELII